MLGEKRVSKTFSVFDRTDLGIIVTNFADWGNFEETIMEEFRNREIPFVVVFNKSDIHTENLDISSMLDSVKIPYVITEADQ
jgi:signal recognition particle receptor subunit beta